MMKYLPKVINNKYFLTLIGFSIVCYIIYIRLILKRAPQYFFTTDVYIYLSFYMSLFFIVLLCIKIYFYYRIKYPKLENKNFGKVKTYIINIITFISSVIDISLSRFDLFLRDNIPFSGNLIEYLARILLRIETVPIKLVKLKLFIELFVPIVFLIEVIAFKQLNIFYYIISLLLVPLVIKYMIHSLNVWYTYQVDRLKDYVYVELVDYVDEHKVTPRLFTVLYCATLDDPINFKIHYLPNYENYCKTNKILKEESLVDITNLLRFVAQVLFYSHIYDKKVSSYKESIYPIITTGIYTIGWCYIFLYLLIQ